MADFDAVTRDCQALAVMTRDAGATQPRAAAAAGAAGNQAMAQLAEVTSQLIQLKISLATTLAKIETQGAINKDQWIVSTVSEFVGGAVKAIKENPTYLVGLLNPVTSGVTLEILATKKLTLPEGSVGSKTNDLLTLCGEAVKGKDVRRAAKLLGEAANEYQTMLHQVNAYFEGLQGGTETAIAALRVAEVAGAVAATVATGGAAASLGLGAVATTGVTALAAGEYGYAQAFAGQKGEKIAGLRTDYDFDAMKSRAAKDFLMGLVGGAAGAAFARVAAPVLGRLVLLRASEEELTAIAARLAVPPSQVPRMLGSTGWLGIVTDFVSGVGSAPIATAFATWLERAEGKAELSESSLSQVLDDAVRQGLITTFLLFITHGRIFAPARGRAEPGAGRPSPGAPEAKVATPRARPAAPEPAPAAAKPASAAPEPTPTGPSASSPTPEALPPAPPPTPAAEPLAAAEPLSAPSEPTTAASVLSATEAPPKAGPLAAKPGTSGPTPTDAPTPGPNATESSDIQSLDADQLLHRVNRLGDAKALRELDRRAGVAKAANESPIGPVRRESGPSTAATEGLESAPREDLALRAREGDTDAAAELIRRAEAEAGKKGLPIGKPQEREFDFDLGPDLAPKYKPGKTRLREGDIDDYARFNTTYRAGDELAGHEVYQFAFMKALGQAMRRGKGAVSRRNPSLALGDELHGRVGEMQKKLGLWDDRISAMTTNEVIARNRRALEMAGIPRQQIEVITRLAERYAQGLLARSTTSGH